MNGMPRPLIELWNDNHGNVLALTLAGILIAGASILAYEQTRFKPVGFPDANSIQGQPSSPRGVIGEGDELLIDITMPRTIPERS